MTLIRAFVRNLRTWAVMLREKAQVDAPRGRKYRSTDRGALLRSSEEAGEFPWSKGGRSSRARLGQRATGGPHGLAGRRQLSAGGTSRMNREVHVRIREGLGGQFPGPTPRAR